MLGLGQIQNVHLSILIFFKESSSSTQTNQDKYGFGNNLKSCEIECGEAIHEFNIKKWNEFLDKMGPNPLSSIPFWKRINRLRNKNSSKDIAYLEENGIKYITDHDKAQVLANRLENVFNDDKNNNFDQEHLEHVNKAVDNDEISKLYTEPQKKAKSFTMRDISKCIKNINNKTSIDQFGISNKILHHDSQKRD